MKVFLLSALLFACFQVSAGLNVFGSLEQVWSLFSIRVLGHDPQVTVPPRSLQNSQQDLGGDEASALCAFYRSVPPTGQALLTNWCGAQTPSGDYINGTCSESAGAWLGVTCKRPGPGGRERVSDVNLDNLGLGGGNLPANIGKLESMTFLRLSGTGLQGTIPAAIGKLTNLKQLWLGNNPGLSGTIPGGLGRLNLAILSISSTGLTGPIPQSFCERKLPSLADIRILLDSPPATTPGISCIPFCMADTAKWPFLRLDPNIANNLCTPSPTTTPTLGPTDFPTAQPTTEPTDIPTLAPVSSSPTRRPTAEPTTKAPSFAPSLRPSRKPTNLPSPEPTMQPTTSHPTLEPTFAPSPSPPTPEPSLTPTFAPFVQFGDEWVLCRYYNSLPASGRALLRNWCGPRSGADGNYVPPACTPNNVASGSNVWLGVTCCLDLTTGRDRVCDVNLPNLGLGNGSIPSNIGDLGALTYLNLEGTGLGGSIPASLASIAGIQQIWLRNNLGLTGTLPKTFGSPVILASLSNLHLSNTRLGYPVDAPRIDSSRTVLPKSLCSLPKSLTFRTLRDPGFECYPACLSTAIFINFSPGQPQCSPPTTMPTNWPSFEPTLRPTHRPSRRPSRIPTSEPTMEPTQEPSFFPSLPPSPEPSMIPTTAMPTGNSMYSDASILCKFWATLPADDATLGQNVLTNWCGPQSTDGNYKTPVCSLDGSGKTTWKGVTCCYYPPNAGGGGVDRVCDVNLFNQRLGPGILPANIGGLDALTYLNLRGTGISGSIPPSFSIIAGIQQIWLSDNRILGNSIPNNLGSAVQLKRLSMVHMSNTALSGVMPSSLCSLSHGVDLRTQRDPRLGCYPPCLNTTRFFNFRPGKNQRQCSPPTPAPSPEPSMKPTRRPSHRPTTEPTTEPSPEPSAPPTFAPTHGSNQSDGDILCCYYDTMDEKERKKLTNWCGPKSPKTGEYINGTCSEDAGAWLGVTCKRPKPGGRERVTDVNLPNFHSLGGHLPSCIGGLAALSYLNLRGTGLGVSGEPLPSQLGNLLALEQLWLGDNPLGGTVPATISKLAKLRNLYLSDTQISGAFPASICSLPDFAQLDLRIIGDSHLTCYPACLDENVFIRKDPPRRLQTCPTPAPSARPSHVPSRPSMPLSILSTPPTPRPSRSIAAPLSLSPVPSSSPSTTAASSTLAPTGSVPASSSPLSLSPVPSSSPSTTAASSTLAPSGSVPASSSSLTTAPSNAVASAAATPGATFPRPSSAPPTPEPTSSSPTTAAPTAVLFAFPTMASVERSL